MGQIKFIFILLLTLISVNAETIWTTGAYKNNASTIKILEIPNAEVLEVAIKGETEKYYDFIYIYDEKDNVVAKLHGHINETLKISGSKITAKLVSDFSITKAGVTITLDDMRLRQSWSTGAYTNDEDRRQVLTIENAKRLRVIIKGETERYYDFFYVYDENGIEIKKLHGNIDTNFTVVGSQITARLRTDFSITKSGVNIRIEDDTDTTKPIITLNGEKTIYITQGDTYNDEGATAYDEHDGLLTDKIIIDNNVDTSKVGSYTVTYNVSDSSGNNADEIMRTVVVDSNKVFAFYADEYLPDRAYPEGNRILQIDLETMEFSESLDVPGFLVHHVDQAFRSKVYSVPEESNYINVIELAKDTQDHVSMVNTKKINLIHTPRSADAYNDKYHIVLLSATNRPMGTFIDVDTDEIVGTIGEDVDCTLYDGTQLLSHADANTHEGAMKYECALGPYVHGGTQISGHPYWLTTEIAAIVDRTNNQISVYKIHKEGNRIKSELMNHMKTRTSVHQIVARDRTSLPPEEQADFYAIEEGKYTDPDHMGGIPHALIHLKLTQDGLVLVRRMSLQREQSLGKSLDQDILDECINIYLDTVDEAFLTGAPVEEREERYQKLFDEKGIIRSAYQEPYNDLPIDCFYPGIPGGHNGDFAPNNKHLYIGMAGGAMSIVDVNKWKIVNNIDIGIGTGPGHTSFSAKHNVALVTTHAFTLAFQNRRRGIVRTIKDINTDRPTTYYWIKLPFNREFLTETAISHTGYVDKNEEYYYNFFSDGGVFYKIDLEGIYDNPLNGSSDLVVDSVYTGGIPIQGSFIRLKDIQKGEQ